MNFRRPFPRALALCLALNAFAFITNAQTDTRPSKVSVAPQSVSVAPPATDPVIVSLAPVDEPAAGTAPGSAPRLSHFREMMMAAIDLRIGMPYRLGATGPDRFDCSGFVWSVFQSAGVNFERRNARDLWTQLAPAPDGEQFKFGTLVFFNDLKHVGIVADKDGFYHASTSQGVTYSPFNDYWTARIDGYRRMPAGESPTVASLR